MIRNPKYKPNPFSQEKTKTTDGSDVMSEDAWAARCPRVVCMGCGEEFRKDLIGCRLVDAGWFHSYGCFVRTVGIGRWLWRNLWYRLRVVFESWWGW